jgi:hypothetical protein
MATKPRSSEQPEQQEGEEPERVVDPPSATPADTADPEQASDRQWVLIDQTGVLTLPSGASYAFAAGQVLQLTSEDAAFVIDQGYGSETTDPTAPVPEPKPEPEAEAPSEE